jgi:hypothetical protein
MSSAAENESVWPPLPFESWQATAETLHMWTQIVGKIRLRLSPWINHSWHVTLYLTSRGLTTSPIPHGQDTFELRFDFLDHHLRILKSDGGQQLIPLRAKPVAQFYEEVMSGLRALQLPVKIDLVPNEITDPIPFDRDTIHRDYDPEFANRFWRVLVQSDRVFKIFRACFCGKCSPVHFFWGSFDLAVTRFSGRPAPPHPGGVPHLPDTVAREAYAQEVSSLGFWPGSAASPTPLYYSYAYPEPAGFAQAIVRPNDATYSPQLHEFTLPYEAARNAASPEKALLEFAESTYDAASRLGKWDRAALDEANLHPPLPNE